mgnify:CR=1 FL=1
MSLKEWDRKVKTMKQELASLCSYKENPIDGKDLKLEMVQKKLPQTQHNLEKIFAYIHSVTNRKKFLSSQEKAILHWAREYTNKAQNYYKQYLQAINEVFWARLVYTRGTSITLSSEHIKGKKKKNAIHSLYQKNLLDSRRQLKRQLRKIREKKEELQEKYDRIANIKANREAMANSNVSDAHHAILVSLFDHSSKEIPSKNTGEDSWKLVQLASKIAPVGEDLRVEAMDTRPPLSYDAIKKFDYLNIDDELNDFGPAEPALKSLDKTPI